MGITELFKKLTSSRKLIIAFISATIVGSILLMMPFSLQKGESISFLTAIFTITSAICVTGLSVVDVSKVFSTAGQLIILVFIQLGGLGIMTFSSMLFLIAGRKMTFHERMILRDERNANSGEIVDFVKRIFFTVFMIESIGAVILTNFFMKELNFTLGKALYYGIFHSISAFCNAGFSLFTDSLEGFATRGVFNMTVAYLIILGGIGFAVINSFVIGIRKNINRFNLTSKLAIFISLLLTFGGTLLIFLLEYTNPNTIGGMSFFDKIIASFFQSVTLRTAGFNTIPIGSLKNGTILLSCIFMFIGASPGSTGGGIKTTTLGVLAFYVAGIVKGKENVEIFNRSIAWDILNRALAILVISIVYIGIVMLLILTFDGFRFEEVVFEVISAYATVGLSMGITAELGIFSRLLIIITMFIGRLGPLTFALAIGERKNKEKLSYPKENILVG